MVSNSSFTYLECTYPIPSVGSVSETFAFFVPQDMDRGNLNIFIFLACILNGYFLVGIVLMFHYRRSDIFLQRVPVLIYITAACCICYANISLLNFPNFSFLYAYLPCFIEVWLIFLLIPNWLLCYYLRTISIVANFFLNKIILDSKLKRLTKQQLPYVVRIVIMVRKISLKVTMKKLPMMTSIISSTSASQSQMHQQNKGVPRIDGASLAPSPPIPNSPSPLLNSFHNSLSDQKAGGLMMDEENENEEGPLPKLQETSSETNKDQPSEIVKITPRVLYLVFGFFFFVSIIGVIIAHIIYPGISIFPADFPKMMTTQDNVQLLLTTNKSNATMTWSQLQSQSFLQCFSGCRLVSDIIIQMCVPAFILEIATMPYFIYMLAKVTTANLVYIKQEIMLYLVVQVPLFIAFYLISKQSLAESIQNLVQSTSIHRYTSLERPLRLALSLWSFTLSIMFPGILAWHRDRQPPEPNSNSDHFNIMLGNKKSLQKFKDFTTKQLCGENVLFMEHFFHCARSLMPMMGEVAPKQVHLKLQSHFNSGKKVHSCTRKLVRNLYTMFIQENSPYELNILGKTRDEIRQHIDCRELHPIIFCTAWEEVYMLLHVNSFFDFVRMEKQLSQKKKSNV